MALGLFRRRHGLAAGGGSRDFLAAIVESSDDAVIGTGLDGRITAWNAAAERMFGYGAAEIVGQPVPRILAAGSVRVFQRDFETLRRGERVGPHPVWHRRKDGTEFEVSLSAGPVRDRAGAVVGAAAIMRDVTELRRLTRELEQSRRFLESIIDNIPAIVVVKDVRDGRWVLCNRAAAEFLGRPAAEIVGKTNFDLFGRKEAEFITASDVRAVALGYYDIPEEQVSSRTKGPRRVHARKLAVRGADGVATHVVVVVEDVTERRRVERLRNEVISLASHELKSPLTALAGIIGTLVDVEEFGPRDREMLDVAWRTTQRMARMLSDYLDIERIESGGAELSREAVDMGRLLDEAVRSMQAYAERNRIRFSARAEGGPLVVRGDPDRLMQVVMNLLSNAGKFTEPGTAVDVCARRSGARVRVSVTDHGPGIPEDIRGRIFERFVQSKVPGAREKGSGLGLSISKAIVERLAGQIGFDTKPGETTFFFELPAA